MLLRLEGHLAWIGLEAHSISHGLPLKGQPVAIFGLFPAPCDHLLM